MTHKVITHIEGVPEEWISTNDWDSHRELLWLGTKIMRDATFYEFGMGDGSTPLLKVLAHGLHSFETNFAYLNKFIDGYDKKVIRSRGIGDDVLYTEDSHFIWLTSDYLKWSVDTSFDSVVFIDSAPGEDRKHLIDKHKDDAKVLIIHDTEEGADYVYGLKEILSTFKYRLDYQPIGKPATTAVSNSIDVTKWIQ